MSEENEGVGTLMRRATDVAGVCREIVLKTALTIQGRRFVRVEGWQSIAAAYGCVAGSRDPTWHGQDDKHPVAGVSAIGTLRRASDGTILAEAEGFVGDDEVDRNGKMVWGNRPMYARMAMAQTRAISRVCRSAFAFVVVLIDSKLSTTPAEEMDYVDVPTTSSTMPKVFAQTVQRLPEPGSDEEPLPEIPLPPTASTGDLEAQLDARIAAKDFKGAAAVINQAPTTKDKVRMSKKLQAAVT